MFGPWRLSYPDVDYVFGTPDHPVQIQNWGQEVDMYAVDDERVPRGDGVWFGQDFVEPGEVVINAKIDFTAAPYPTEMCVQMAMAARTEISRVWRADTLRNSPGGLAELTIGDQFLIEGRPRRPQFNDDRQSSGFISVKLPFIPAIAGAYELGPNGGWGSVEVGLVPAQQGGLLAPLIAPLTTSRESSRATSFEVGGDSPAWPIITVQGPIQSGAEIELVNHWVLKLNRALNYDDVVVIDTRPNRRSMRLNGTPVNVLNPSRGRVSQASIPPGLHSIALRGASVEGTASLKFEWRNTKAGI